jgi:hypothetical protein
MLNGLMRIAAFALGGLVVLGGIAVVGTGDPASGVVAVLLGAGMMIVAVLQRSRYRSEASERSSAEPGPGGGEPGPLEPRFVPTTEVFRDPASQRRMRVFQDPRTGERRYVAED